MVRTQLYLDEELHDRLRRLAARQGRTMSDLVRDALVRAYGAGDIERRRKTLNNLEGLWRDRKDLGQTDAYVRRLRRDTRRTRRKG
jgi:plasmid stability protein